MSHRQPPKEFFYVPPEEMSRRELIHHAAYSECDVCASKPGSPTLCAACIHNRSLVFLLQKALK